MKSPVRRNRVLGPLFVTALALAAISACAVAAPPSPQTGTDPAGARAAGDALLAMDACMERAGHDLLTVDADGRSSIDFGDDDPRFRADFERCQSETGFSGFGPPSLSPEDVARGNEQRQRMIECMKERGWELGLVPGQVGGVILPDVPPGQQDVFNRDLADCGGDGMVHAEPVGP